MKHFEIMHRDGYMMYAGESDTFCKFVEKHKGSLDWANLRGAKLTRAKLGGANLSGADLTGANLVEAELTDTNLEWANLAGAKLTGADLTGARLNWATFAGAILNGVILDGARINWVSHDLIAELLVRAAEEDEEKLALAGLVLIGRRVGWCWKRFFAMAHPQQAWALGVLAPWVQDGDNAPEEVKRFEKGINDE